MRYTLLLHYPEATAEDIGQDVIDAGMAAFHAYAKSLEDAGVLISAEVLQPVASATTVTTKDGSLYLQDGPFADTKEQLGGTLPLGRLSTKTLVLLSDLRRTLVANVVGFHHRTDLEQGLLVRRIRAL